MRGGPKLYTNLYLFLISSRIKWSLPDFVVGADGVAVLCDAIVSPMAGINTIEHYSWWISGIMAIHSGVDCMIKHFFHHI